MNIQSQTPIRTRRRMKTPLSQNLTVIPVPRRVIVSLDKIKNRKISKIKKTTKTTKLKPVEILVDETVLKKIAEAKNAVYGHEQSLNPPWSVDETIDFLDIIQNNPEIDSIHDLGRLLVKNGYPKRSWESVDDKYNELLK